MNRKIIIILVFVVIALFIIGSASAGVFEFKDEGDGAVRIGYLPSDHDSALFVADAKGYFEKKEIDINLIKYNNGDELMKAMEDGEIDVGYVGVAPALYHMGKGVEAKIISSAQNEGSGLVVSSASGIYSASDLTGKKIAIPGEGTIQELLLSYYLKDNAISNKDVKIKTVKAKDMSTKLCDGEIDAAMTFQPFVTIAESEGNTLLAGSSDILPNHPCCVVVASDTFISDSPDDAEKIVKIHKKATKFINKAIEEGKTSKVVELLPDEIVSDADLEAKSLESFPFTSGMSGNFKSNVMTFQKLEGAMGAIKEPMSESEIFWEA